MEKEHVTKKERKVEAKRRRDSVERRRASDAIRHFESSFD
jgi:hypothetical protein